MKRAVIIDNYDSFTHNLAQLMVGLVDEVLVLRNDSTDLGGLLALEPSALVLSPGPGRPDRKRDFGVCADVVEAAKEPGFGVPLLGVCLGHQGIAYAFGAAVVRAPAVMHGKTSRIDHRGTGLFSGLPDRMEVMRYHSLVVDPATVPEVLIPTAETDDGVLMGLRHRALPVEGVQFHPESVGTPEGRRLMANFLGAAVR